MTGEAFARALRALASLEPGGGREQRLIVAGLRLRVRFSANHLREDSLRALRGTADHPYGPKELDTFAAAMAAADGKVLLHYTIAWRASHLWAAYLIRERKVPVAEALTQTRMINLMDDMRMGSSDQQPLEGFLGRAVPEMGHPQ